MPTYFFLLVLLVIGMFAFQFWFKLKPFSSIKEAVITITVPAILGILGNWVCYLTGYNTFNSSFEFRLFGLGVETYIMAFVAPYFVMLVNAYSKKNGLFKHKRTYNRRKQ